MILLLAIGCQKEDLVLLNPNAPGIASLNSEAGIKAFAMGIAEKPFGWAQAFRSRKNFKVLIPDHLAVEHFNASGMGPTLPLDRPIS